MIHVVVAPLPGEDVIQVYEEVFRAPPYEEGEDVVAEFARRLAHHRRRPGFACLIARDNHRTVGFGYGFRWFTGEPPSPWYGELVASLGEQVVDEHVRGAFEVRELAVRARWRGQGVGTVLLDGLLTAAACSRAWLVVHGGATQARAFYARRGWHEIGRVGSDQRVLALRRWQLDEERRA